MPEAERKRLRATMHERSTAAAGMIIRFMRDVRPESATLALYLIQYCPVPASPVDQTQCLPRDAVRGVRTAPGTDCRLGKPLARFKAPQSAAVLRGKTIRQERAFSCQLWMDEMTKPRCVSLNVGHFPGHGRRRQGPAHLGYRHDARMRPTRAVVDIRHD